ncbi:MAG: hydroxymethylpyrimidine/phosphomethylpyrimidine kinase [Candidatus Aureabacteria bacterium]|nr:hydroxymethylpyrimidine/phosphomethylpyrimidine kinase [Candidatus Auribacterota bacterium]
MKKNMPVLLVISGLDPSNHAGYGSDIRIATSIGVHPVGVITALTAQNPVRFEKAYSLPSSLVQHQLTHLLSYYSVQTVKIGMVYSPGICRIISEVIKKIKMPVITDTVLTASRGGTLLKTEAWNAYHEVLRSSDLITPNIPEAMKLAATNHSDPRELCARLHDLYGAAVLVKGGHSKGNILVDWYHDGRDYCSWKRKRVSGVNTHGTGCMLSSAIAAFRARGYSLIRSIHLAEEFLTRNFKNSVRIQSDLFLPFFAG